ncbi:DUF397 domain-containing protein [Streptomyces sp. NPDC059917]|uniref:DUF397 domain-containing protein n=1 Tax=Streptomyces sp. NPDC059917 TaxID=3347002 RepID=UPI003668BB4D
MSTPLTWFKSSYSSDQGGQCLEVATGTGSDTVHVRDSKLTDGPTLAVSPATWADLTRWVAA